MYELGEGFAEWLHAFIVNPKEAISHGPEIYKLYESKVAEDYKKALTNYSNDVRTWAGASGRDMVLSNIEWKPTAEKNIIQQIFSKSGNKDMFSITWVDKLSANWVNSMRAFEKAISYTKGIKGIDEVLPANDPEILSRLFLSIDRKYGEFLENGLRDADDNLLTDIDGKAKNFKWLIEPLDNTDVTTIKNEMQDVVSYMVAERTVELGNRFQREDILTGIGGGIYRDIDVALKALEEFHNGDRNKLERIQLAASRYREFGDDIMKYMVDKGRLSSKVYEEIKKNNLQYVALHRILEAEPGTEIHIFSGKSKSIAAVNDPIKKISGSTRKITNPYVSLLDTMYKSIRESDRNDVFRAFTDLIRNERGMYEGDVKAFRNRSNCKRRG